MGRKKKNKPPFKLESEVKYKHQRYFLHYINELTDIEAELKKMTAQCEMLFGKMPQIENYDELRKVQSSIWEIVGKCLWKETREFEGVGEWVRILGKFCEKFSPTNKAITIYAINLGKIIQTEIKERFEFWASSFSIQYEFTKEKITESQMSLWLHCSHWQCIGKNDETYQKLLETERQIITELEDFQKAFDFILEKFCLEKRWLAESVFRSIWDGTGKLKHYGSFVEYLTDEICDEIKGRLEEQQGGTRVIKIKCDFLQTSANIPFHNPFQYKEHLWLYEPLERYEEEAVEAYRQHIRNYLKTVENVLIESGYKRPHKPKYERVQWLVWWNVLGWTKKKISQEIGDTTKNSVSDEALRKCFRQLQSYDLPLRE